VDPGDPDCLLPAVDLNLDSAAILIGDGAAEWNGHADVKAPADKVGFIFKPINVVLFAPAEIVGARFIPETAAVPKAVIVGVTDKCPPFDEVE
jgi:hypothetical protein